MITKKIIYKNSYVKIINSNTINANVLLDENNEKIYDTEGREINA